MVSSSEIKAGAAYVELVLRAGNLTLGLEKSSRKLRAFSKQANKIGLKMFGMTSLFSAPFLGSAKSFASFEQQMANVSTMLDNPQVQMKQFRREILKMSAEFGESTEALAGGLYDILSASVPTEHALDVLSVAVRAAKAGMTDTATAADAITTVLNSYGLSADRAGDVSDFLFGIVKRGKLTFEQIAGSIGNVSNIASTAGVSLEELGGMIALLTRNGIKTEEAITSVNAIITSFLKPSAEGAAIAKKLGIELSAAGLKSEGLLGIFKKLEGLPPDVLSKIFPNVRAIKGVLPALKSLEGFEGDIKAMAGRAGSTEEAYKKMTHTIMHWFKQLKQVGVAIFVEIGDAISGSLGRGIKAIKRVGTVIQEFISSNKALVLTLFKVVALFGLLTGGVLALGVGGATLSFVFGGMASILSGVGIVIGALGTAIAFLLTPMGLVSSGIVLLGTYFVNASGTINSALVFLKTKFEKLSAIASQAFGGIKRALAAKDFKLAGQILWLGLKLAFQNGIAFVTKQWVSFKNFFLKVAADAFFGTALLLNQAWANLQTSWVETTAFLSRNWIDFTSTLQSAWNEAQRFLQKGILEVMALFDKNLDKDLAKSLVDREANKLNEEVKRKEEEAKAKTESSRKNKRKEIEDEKERNISTIIDSSNLAESERKKKEKEDLKKTKDDLKKAKDEFEKALKKSQPEEGDFGEDEVTDDSSRRIDYDKNKIDTLRDQLRDLNLHVGDLQGSRKTDIKGTFSASSIKGLGTGAVNERTAKAAEETAKNTKKLVNRTSTERTFT